MRQRISLGITRPAASSIRSRTLGIRRAGPGELGPLQEFTGTALVLLLAAVTGMVGYGLRLLHRLVIVRNQQRLDAVRPAMAVDLDIACRRPDSFAFIVRFTNVGKGPALDVTATMDAFFLRQQIIGHWIGLPRHGAYAVNQQLETRFVVDTELASMAWTVIDSLRLPLAHYPQMLGGALVVTYMDVHGQQFWTELRFRSRDPIAAGLQIEQLPAPRKAGG